jgi:hypothetical protein
MSRYTIPPDYSGGDSEDRAALIGWQNDELSSEDAWLRAEARRWDKPTPEDMEKYGSLEGWFKARDAHFDQPLSVRKEKRDE